MPCATSKGFPSSDSLGRLNGQYPGLFYVACANNVGVATSRANKLRAASTAGRITTPIRGTSATCTPD
jgi:hypothetical protein